LKNETTFGLQSTLRCINNSKATYVILDDQINPKWFGKHLVTMTLSKKESKIIIIQNLKKVTKQIFNRSTMIFCVKTGVNSFDRFYETLDIHEKLLKFYRHIQPQLEKPEASNRQPKKLKPEIITPIVHLKRYSDKLAFETIDQIQEKIEVEDSGDFICLKKYEDKSVLKSKAPVAYRPMKIKQVLSNPDRKKRKIN
jgi:hypothetical protein